MVRDGKTGFIVPPEDPSALAGAVVRFFDEDRAADFATQVAGEKEKYSWDRMVEAVERLAFERTEDS